MEKVPNLLCKSCGFQVSENDSYCQKCGGKLLKQSTSFLGQYSNFTKVTTFLISTTIFLVVLFLVKGKEAIPSDLSSLGSPTADTQQAENNPQVTTKDWIEYDSVNGNFKILFPDWPSHDSGKATAEDPFDYDTYSTVLPNGTEYAAFVYKYTQELDPMQEDFILEAIANAAKVTLEGELTESKYITFKGHRALDFLIYTQNDNSYFRGVAFLRNNHTVYYLAVAYKSENESEVQFEKFSNSFTLK